MSRFVLLFVIAKVLRLLYSAQRLSIQQKSTTKNITTPELPLYTLLSKQAIKQALLADKAKRLAPQLLAQSVSLLVHGEQHLQAVELCSKLLYSKSTKAELFALSKENVQLLSTVVPCVDKEFEEGVTARKLAQICVPVKAQAESVLTGGGFYINLEKMKDPEKLLKYDVDTIHGCTVLRCGKRDYTIIRWKK